MPLPTDDDEELDEEVLDTLYLKVYTGQLDTTSTSAPPPPKEATAAGDGPDKATAKGEKKEEEGEDGEVVDEKRKAELAREKDEEEVAQLVNIATETKVCVCAVCRVSRACCVRELTCAVWECRGREVRRAGGIGDRRPTTPPCASTVAAPDTFPATASKPGYPARDTHTHTHTHTTRKC
jgi:hypothetical protein